MKLKIEELFLAMIFAYFQMIINVKSFTDLYVREKE